MSVAVVLTNEAYAFLSPYIDPYVREERSGNHIYGESFEQIGAFFVITATSETTGAKITDPMKVFIPVQFVKFAVESGRSNVIGFGVSDAPQAA